MAKMVLHPTITLIGSSDNPNGRKLIQINSTIIVLSECCAAQISEGGSHNTCANCDEQLCRGAGWSTSIDGVDAWAGDEVPISLHKWLSFWFGMEDMNMVVT